MKTWHVIVYLKQLLMCFPTKEKSKKKKKKAGCSRQVPSLPLFGQSLLLGLAFVDEGSM